MKYLKFVRDNFDDARFPVFRSADLRASLGIRGISRAYLKRMVNHMLKTQEIKRITSGIYTFHDDITVVGFAFRPFYYGLENALTLRKLWEQGTNPVVVTPRNVRGGVRKFGEGNYLIQRIDKRLFFGYDLIRYYDFWIPVSDYEKTLIDFVYFDHYLRPDVLSTLKREVDKKKISKYLGAYDPEVRNRIQVLLGGIKKKSSL